MADQIVSWGGFNSKGTSGMGVTGSLNVSGSATITNGAAILNGATIYNNLTIETSNLPKLSLYDPLQTHTWEIRSNGTSLSFIDQGNSRLWIGGIGSGNAGKVGINTSSTSAQLTVKGSGTTSSTTALLVQNANASSSLVVNDAGYVGIGASPSATSPVYLYQNTGSSISDLEIFHEYPSSLSQRAYTNLTLTSKQLNGNHGSQYINFKHVGGNVGTFVGGALIFDLYDGGTGYSYYQVQTKVSGESLATRFAIDQNGSTLLGRNGGNEPIIITEPTFAGTSPSSTKTIGIFSNNQAAGWGGFGLIIKAGPANNNLSTNLKGGELYLRAGESLGTGGSDILLQIPTPSGSAGTVLNSTYQTAMLISGSGNIGIGTLLPTAKLHISGASNSVLFEIDSPAVNNILYVSGSGNVGIGTDTPTSRLSVAGNINLGSNFIGNGTTQYVHCTGASGEFRFKNGSGGGWYYTWCQNSSDGLTERMRLSTSNNLLIGTTTDSARLTVKGSGATSSTTSLLVQDSNGSSAFEVKDDRSATVYGPLTLGRANTAYIYASATDYIALPRQGGAAPGYLSNSTINDGWAITSPAGVYFNVKESGLGNPNGGITYQEYSGYNYGRNTFRIHFTGSFATTTLVLKGNAPVAYAAGLNLLIAGGNSGDYNGVDARGAAGTVTVEGGSATSSSFTTHIAGAGVNIQTGLGLGSGSAADLTFSTSTTSSVASTYHTQTQRMIIKGHTGNVGIGISTPSASLHVSGAFLGYPVTVPTASGTASLDCNLGNFFNLTLSSSYTLFLSASNVQPGQTINLRVIQPATSGSLNYGSQFKFAGGIPYSASATGSTVDIISFISYDTTTLYGSAIKNLS